MAPVATDGIRPWTALKPCDNPKKRAGDFDEQPMPENSPHSRAAHPDRKAFDNAL
jgi:hypothetical protein